MTAVTLDRVAAHGDKCAADECGNRATLRAHPKGSAFPAVATCRIHKADALAALADFIEEEEGR